jgi:hypothetical protein
MTDIVALWQNAKLGNSPAAQHCTFMLARLQGTPAHSTHVFPTHIFPASQQKPLFGSAGILGMQNLSFGQHVGGDVAGHV